jgi:SHS2 domain-containing protein
VKRFEEMPHTADIAARIYGATLAELFVNAAYALFGMSYDTAGMAGEVPLDVYLESHDNESLIVKWLNELLYLSESKGLVFTGFDVTLTFGCIQGKVYGLERSSVEGKKEIKAATFHDIKFARTDKGFETVIVFDV